MASTMAVLRAPHVVIRAVQDQLTSDGTPYEFTPQQSRVPAATAEPMSLACARSRRERS